MQFVSATATGRSLDDVSSSLIQQVKNQLGDQSPDLLMVFLSAHFNPSAFQIGEMLRNALNPTTFLGCTAEGVIGQTQEIETESAVTLIAAVLPNVELTPIFINGTDWHSVLDNAGEFREHLGVNEETTKLFMLIGDPFSTPANLLLDAFNRYYDGVPVVGGMASGGVMPGNNSLLINDQIYSSGTIGVAFSGALSADVIVSQGCRPIGAPYTVTEAEDNIIYTLERIIPEVHLENLIRSLSDEDQVLVQNGLFIGRAVNPEQDHDYGRGDFLIRGVLGVEHDTGALVVGDQVLVGETVQFHLRDAKTAVEDLDMMLLTQSFLDTPAGGVLFTCNGRGTNLYDYPNGDISAIQGALGDIPMAGFFAAGEIGPIGGANFLNSQTACMVFFRPAED